MHKQPPDLPMTLGNMRELGVRHLTAYCLNNACRHSALIDCVGLCRSHRNPGMAGEVQQVRRQARGRPAQLERKTRDA
jgi:hypothetical protein